MNSELASIALAAASIAQVFVGILAGKGMDWAFRPLFVHATKEAQTDDRNANNDDPIELRKFFHEEPDSCDRRDVIEKLMIRASDTTSLLAAMVVSTFSAGAFALVAAARGSPLQPVGWLTAVAVLASMVVFTRKTMGGEIADYPAERTRSGSSWGRYRDRVRSLRTTTPYRSGLVLANILVIVLSVVMA